MGHANFIATMCAQEVCKLIGEGFPSFFFLKVVHHYNSNEKKHSLGRIIDNWGKDASARIRVVAEIDLTLAMLDMIGNCMIYDIMIYDIIYRFRFNIIL